MMTYINAAHWKKNTIANFTINNPSNDNRIVTDLEVNANEKLSKALKISGKIEVEQLTKKFGYAFGLQTEDQALDSAETSMIYFYNADGKTYINVSDGGVDGAAPVDLGSDLTTLGEISYTLEVNPKGDVTFTFGDQVVDTLKIKNVSGKIGIVTKGEGHAVVKLSTDTQVQKYLFRGREEGATVADANFDNGKVNPEEFEYAGYPAKTFEDTSLARGIVLEDGKRNSQERRTHLILAQNIAIRTSL